jgi:hypothetical protein
LFNVFESIGQKIVKQEDMMNNAILVKMTKIHRGQRKVCRNKASLKDYWGVVVWDIQSLFVWEERFMQREF